jgi:predicted HAD superfamily Cof-like phosphohydrolase
VTKLRHQVAHFHELAGQPILDRPQVPSEERVRLRLRLIAEEFCELLEACGYPKTAGKVTELIADTITDDDGLTRGCVDLVEVADALADLDYVIEGTRLEFGINGEPIADEVHRSNLSKFPTTVDERGKVKKSDHFSQPDIGRCLREQGWEP